MTVKLQGVEALKVNETKEMSSTQADWESAGSVEWVESVGGRGLCERIAYRLQDVS